MDIRKAVLALCLLTAPACADPISGYVHKDGTVDVPSTLYTVTHGKPGHYSIVFATPMLPKASCVITPVGTLEHYKASPPAVWRLEESDTECSFVIRYSGLGGKYDSDFSFIAVPMSN